MGVLFSCGACFRLCSCFSSCTVDGQGFGTALLPPHVHISGYVCVNAFLWLNPPVSKNVIFLSDTSLHHGLQWRSVIPLLYILHGHLGYALYGKRCRGCVLRIVYPISWVKGHYAQVYLQSVKHRSLKTFSFSGYISQHYRVLSEPTVSTELGVGSTIYRADARRN